MEYFLTIAASDNSGGAGIQQDMRVAQSLGYWTLSALTGITVQNFNSVSRVEAISPDLLQQQIDECLKSFSVKAIKIGAICSTDNIVAIVHSLKSHLVKLIILDPVLASTSGKGFLDSSALSLLTEQLFPLTELITPNRSEFELLTEQYIDDIDTAVEIARDKCKEWNTSILLKGGHYNCATIKEAIVTKTEVFRFERQRKQFQYQHGTGCTLSSALACYVGKGCSLTEAYTKASEYLLDFYDSVQDEIKIINE